MKTAKFVLRDKWQEDWGFSLLELLLVIAIVGIIGVVALPRMGSLHSEKQLEKAAQLMATEMRYIRQNAMASGKTCIIYFLDSSNLYRVNTPDENRYERLPEGISYSCNNFPGRLSFNRRGIPNRAGTLSLVNEKGDKLYIIVNLKTGRVRVSDSPPDNWL